MSHNSEGGSPRVLVLCAEPFNSERGSGITLTNLFGRWEREKLFSVYWLDVAVDTKVCRHYCKIPAVSRRLGSILNRPYPSSVAAHAAAETVAPANRVGLIASLMRKVAILDSWPGFSECLRHICIPAAALKSIKDFRPQVIYCVLSSLQAASIAYRLYQRLGIPLVIHIFDDWISLQPGTLFERLPGLGGLRRYEKVMRLAKVHLAIGPDMAQSYAERYGLRFTPLQNPVDPGIWDLPMQPCRSAESGLRLRFTGNLYCPGNLSGIKEFAHAIEVASASAGPLYFEIYAPSEVVKLYQPMFAGYPHTSLHPVPTDVRKLTELYNDAAALVIAMDSAGAQGSLLKLSMPTKIPSILMSGRPLLIYAPPEAAVVKFAKRHDVGYVIHAPASTAQLADGISMFLADNHRRFTRASAGKRLAHSMFATIHVQPLFAKLLTEAASGVPGA
jgi:hypothetical protein